MRSVFDNVLNRLIQREGGYVNDKNDAGGETKYGISKRSYPHEDIKNLTIARAKEIYIRDFILPQQIDQIENEKLAEVVLDWMVHSGASTVKSPQRIKALQRLLGVEVDGQMGPETLTALNRWGELAIKPILLDRMFFMARMTKHPHIVGWLRRLTELGL